MARPWYSFYPADYGRDTGHLTLVEHGAYRVLMDHYYATAEPLPDDLVRLIRLTRAKTAAERDAVSFVLQEFFTREADGYRHKRIDAEIAKAEEHLANSSFGGKLSAIKRRLARALPSDGASESQASQSQSQSKDIDVLFEEFWLAYPRKEARGPAVKAWAKAVERAPPATLVLAAKAYARSREGEDAHFTRLPATWLFNECWLDETPDTARAADEGEAARAWDGRAAPLVADIGAANFKAYFGSAVFSPGPPARIVIAKPHLRALIGQRFTGALTRAFGEFSLEAT